MNRSNILFHGKYRTRLQNAVLVLKNADGKSRTKLSQSIDTTYSIFKEILSDLKKVGFVKEETEICQLSSKTNTPRFALSNNPKTVTRWNYMITYKGRQFLNLYYEMISMLDHKYTRTRRCQN